MSATYKYKKKSFYLLSFNNVVRINILYLHWHYNKLIAYFINKFKSARLHNNNHLRRY